MIAIISTYQTNFLLRIDMCDIYFEVIFFGLYLNDQYFILNDQYFL